MSYRIFTRGAYFYIVDNANEREYDGLSKHVKVTRSLTTSDVFRIDGVDNWGPLQSINLADIQNENGDVYTLDDFVFFYERNTGQKSGTVDISIQDSTSPLIVIRASELKSETTLTALAVIDANTFTVADATGVIIDDQFTVFSTVDQRYSIFDIIGVLGNVITVDSPIDFAYKIGSFVQIGNHNLAVDGSVTPRIFGVRNTTANDLDLSLDFTRMIFSMELTSSGDYDEFGNITALDNGLVCRFKDGEIRNIFNAKNNRELDNLMYDLKFIPASGGAPDGLSGRFTFAKLGSVIRIAPFEDLQFIVQDDLSGLTTFEIICQGAGVTK
jgi:hypothetical protein